MASQGAEQCVQRGSQSHEARLTLPLTYGDEHMALGWQLQDCHCIGGSCPTCMHAEAAAAAFWRLRDRPAAAQCNGSEDHIFTTGYQVEKFRI